MNLSISNLLLALPATPLEWIAQIAGILGIVASVLSFQCKKHKPLLILRTANELLFGVQYCLLGAYTGMAMNIVGSTRNLIFVKMVEKDKNTLPARIIFSAAFLVFCAFTWDGLKSVMVGIAKVVSTFAYGNKNVALVRILIFFTSAAWFTYNFLVGSTTGCINEFLNILSIIIAVCRYGLKGEKTQPLTESEIAQPLSEKE